METVCLDTDAVIEFAKRRVIRYIHKELRINVTIITVYEYLRGLAYLGRDVSIAKQELERRFEILYLTNNVVTRASELYSKLKRKGIIIQDPDILIASTCIVSNITLATYNTTHYDRLKQYGLKLIDPETIIKSLH